MGTVAEYRSASEFVGMVGTVPNDYYDSMNCTVNETETANAWGSVQRGRPMQHEERMPAPRIVEWERPVQYEETVNAAGQAYWERPEHYEQLVMNKALRGEREDEQLVKNEPPRGERYCVEQLEGVHYFEPSASGDQTMERSGDSTQTAVTVKNKGLGVPKNAVKNDDRTPGVPSTEPFVEEGPSVKCKLDEVATVPNGEAPVEHEETIKTATVSVCTGATYRCFESLPVKIEKVEFEIPRVENQQSEVPVKLESSPEDIGAPALNENLPTNFLSANGLAELGDPNNLSDATEPTPNLEMLPENADSGSVLGTLNEDANFAQRERVVAATTNSVDPVAHAELEDTTEKPKEDTTKEDDAGSPPPHARLGTHNELHDPGGDALSVGANEKSVCENALVTSSIPRICMVQTEDSDELDVGGGGHVYEGPDLHGGGLVPVGESLASNRLRGVTLECVEQDVGARAHTVQVYGGVAVEVGELHGIYGVRLVPAANGYAKGAVDYRITLSVDELRMDEERSARERKITSWTGVLPVLLVLGTLTLGAQVLVRWLLNESRDDGWWTSLL
ncbi:hypothetical protein PF002_g1593 [Phytophthora fragariae]|uniref:Uncharacterized protein n=3 Tax=Phytophthora fragariae TaxID=53985 RepID=A0A6A3SN88_9STRA|nr:hypothetical protein PF003_g39153 [Phytophthora fragariae]KAE9017440.1 hypothetical protein PF011_g6700 [Phytophthora fragariae]KAE9120350.1 hypothetical protein PF007_g8198 [Phytophthora fragariae]KAE9256836.1 hypothetical protein PF002_g1593 [Phytophthora fragariae]KAE9316926.1 hypothetical protein PF001_g7073 [Phytophthora fragariae]